MKESPHPDTHPDASLEVQEVSRRQLHQLRVSQLEFNARVLAEAVDPHTPTSGTAEVFMHLQYEHG